jgi:hypothetical protein
METVPRKEIRQRISRFQTELAANDLEGAFILQSDTESAWRSMNIPSFHRGLMES